MEINHFSRIRRSASGRFSYEENMLTRFSAFGKIASVTLPEHKHLCGVHIIAHRSLTNHDYAAIDKLLAALQQRHCLYQY